METIVRGAQARDLEAVEALLAGAGLPREGVRESFARFLVAEAGDAVVGAIGVEAYGERALLRSAVVDPGWRDRRLGAELTRRAIETARAEGRGELYLLTTTAEAYFPRFGFERVERAEVPEAVRASVEFRGACPDSAVAMRLRLS